MLNFITRNLLWTEGGMLLWGVITLILVGLLFTPALYLGGAAFIFLLFFFRNPERHCPAALRNPKIIVCPADGKIVALETVKGDPDFGQKIAIFLSPFDVHVNWTPVSGTIEKITYHLGSFTMAFLPKSSELNERNDVLLRSEFGTLIRVRQIAGTVARRIVCWVREGGRIKVGHLFGMIKFSSRVEVFLPGNTIVHVRNGQRVYGGHTVLGELQ